MSPGSNRTLAAKASTPRPLAYFGYTIAVTGVLGTDDLRRLDRPTACRHRFGCRKTTAALAQPLI